MQNITSYGRTIIPRRLHLLLKGWMLLHVRRWHVLLWVHRLGRQHLMIGRNPAHCIFSSEPHLLFTIPSPRFFVETIVEPITGIGTFGTPWLVLQVIDFCFKSCDNYSLFTGSGFRNRTEHMADVLLVDVLWNVDNGRSLAFFLLRCSASDSHGNLNFMFIVLTTTATAV